MSFELYVLRVLVVYNKILRASRLIASCNRESRVDMLDVADRII